MDVCKSRSLYKMNGILFLVAQVFILSQSVDATNDTETCDDCEKTLNQFCCIRPKSTWENDAGKKVCCTFPPDIPQVNASSVCTDTDNGATDKVGENCTAYISNEDFCGKHDDDDFVSKNMCCNCGGGQRGPRSNLGPPHLKGMACIVQGVLAAQILPPECANPLKDFFDAVSGLPNVTFLAPDDWNVCMTTLKSKPQIEIALKQKVKEIAPGCGVTVSRGNSCENRPENQEYGCPGDTGCCVDGNCAKGYPRQACYSLRMIVSLFGLMTDASRWDCPAVCDDDHESCCAGQSCVLNTDRLIYYCE